MQNSTMLQTVGASVGQHIGLYCMAAVMSMHLMLMNYTYSETVDLLVGLFVWLCLLYSFVVGDTIITRPFALESRTVHVHDPATIPQQYDARATRKSHAASEIFQAQAAVAELLARMARLDAGLAKDAESHKHSMISSSQKKDEIVRARAKDAESHKHSMIPSSQKKDEIVRARAKDAESHKRSMISSLQKKDEFVRARAKDAESHKHSMISSSQKRDEVVRAQVEDHPRIVAEMQKSHTAEVAVAGEKYETEISNLQETCARPDEAFEHKLLPPRRCTIATNNRIIAKGRVEHVQQRDKVQAGRICTRRGALKSQRDRSRRFASKYNANIHERRGEKKTEEGPELPTCGDVELTERQTFLEARESSEIARRAAADAADDALLAEIEGSEENAAVDDDASSVSSLHSSEPPPSIAGRCNAQGGGGDEMEGVSTTGAEILYCHGSPGNFALVTAGEDEMDTSDDGPSTGPPRLFFDGSPEADMLDAMVVERSTEAWVTHQVDVQRPDIPLPGDVTMEDAPAVEPRGSDRARTLKDSPMSDSVGGSNVVAAGPAMSGQPGARIPSWTFTVTCPSSRPQAVPPPAATTGPLPRPQAVRRPAATTGPLQRPRAVRPPTATSGPLPHPQAVHRPAPTTGPLQRPQAVPPPAPTTGPLPRPQAVPPPAPTTGPLPRPQAVHRPAPTTGPLPRPQAARPQAATTWPAVPPVVAPSPPTVAPRSLAFFSPSLTVGPPPPTVASSSRAVAPPPPTVASSSYAVAPPPPTVAPLSLAFFSPSLTVGPPPPPTAAPPAAPAPATAGNLQSLMTKLAISKHVTSSTSADKGKGKGVDKGKARAVEKLSRYQQLEADVANTNYDLTSGDDDNSPDHSKPGPSTPSPALPSKAPPEPLSRSARERAPSPSPPPPSIPPAKSRVPRGKKEQLPEEEVTAALRAAFGDSGSYGASLDAWQLERLFQTDAPPSEEQLAALVEMRLDATRLSIQFRGLPNEDQPRVRLESRLGAPGTVARRIFDWLQSIPPPSRNAAARPKEVNMLLTWARAHCKMWDREREAEERRARELRDARGDDDADDEGGETKTKKKEKRKKKATKPAEEMAEPSLAGDKRRRDRDDDGEDERGKKLAICLTGLNLG